MNDILMTSHMKWSEGMFELHAVFEMLEESSAPVRWAILTKLAPHLALIAEAALLIVVVFREADMSVNVVRWFIRSFEQGEHVGVDDGGRLSQSSVTWRDSRLTYFQTATSKGRDHRAGRLPTRRCNSKLHFLDAPALQQSA